MRLYQLHKEEWENRVKARRERRKLVSTATPANSQTAKLPDQARNPNQARSPNQLPRLPRPSRWKVRALAKQKHLHGRKITATEKRKLQEEVAMADKLKQSASSSSGSKPFHLMLESDV